jgi:putative transposase
VIVAFIDAYKRAFGVEPICRVLRDHNLPIAPSTYYAFKKRARSTRSLSDDRLVPIVKEVHRENYSVYGVRKMWHALRRQGEALGRDQVARLMRAAGVRGVSRRRVRPAIPTPPAFRAPDLVQRDWVRDFPIACGSRISRTSSPARVGCTSRSCRTPSRVASSASWWRRARAWSSSPVRCCRR